MKRRTVTELENPDNSSTEIFPDEIRKGEPVVLDTERVFTARIEINLLPSDTYQVKLCEILLEIFERAREYDPTFITGNFDEQ